MNTALIELHYFPSVAYFSQLCAHQEICIEQHENYQKGSYRNRCYIAGPNGRQRLSCFLKSGKNEQQSIREVQLSYKEAWHKQHWNSIKTAYGNAPYFEFYADDIQAILFKKHNYLFDLNLDLLKCITKQLSLNIDFGLSPNFTKVIKEKEIIDLRNSITPKQIDKSAPFQYAQVFEDRHGFLGNLSILDLLFCTGPEAALLLRRGK